MGIRCNCPNGHRLNLKSHLAGERGICPECGASFIVPVPESGEKTEPQARVQPPQVPPPIAPPQVPIASPVPPPPKNSLLDSGEPIDIGIAPTNTNPAPRVPPRVNAAPVPSQDYGLRPPEPEVIDDVPKIVIAEHQKITTMRTHAKRGARNAATFLLGVTALVLIVILWMLL